MVASNIALAPARALDWNEPAQRLTLDVIDTLKADVTFMNAMTTREQCHHACRILRVERSPAISSVMIGWVIGSGRTLVKCHFKKGLDSMDTPPRNGRLSALSHDQQKELTQAIVKG
jgi:hypothetical protein